MLDRKSDGFAQRLLIRPPEHRATKKPLLAGYKSGGKKKDAKTEVSGRAPSDDRILTWHPF